MRARIFALAALLALTGACALSGGSLRSSEELARLSGEDAGSLRRGRALWSRECAACHRMYWPEEYPPEDWLEIAPDMAERAGLDPEQGGDLLRFLATASRHARGESQGR